MGILRQALLAAMLGAIGLPLPFSVLVHVSSPAVRQILASPPLTDNSAPPQRPRLSPTTWWRGDFQRGFEAWFANRIEPRGWIVRLTNEVYYALFAKSYMYNRQIIIGRDRYLYELGYLEAYCRNGQEGGGASAPLVARLSDLHQQLAHSGRWLLFLLTPSKAVTMPEFLPVGVCGRQLAPVAARERFVTSLRQAGIYTIDGAELVQAMKISDPLPPFPRGGTHWSRFAGARVIARVLEGIERVSQRDTGEVILDPPRWTALPTGTDADLARLLNLLRPPLDYETASADWRCRRTIAGRNTRLVAVGGSFLDQVIQPIAACALFGRIDYYNYYDRWRFAWPARQTFPVDRTTIRWQEELNQPTVILVELNEALIGEGAPHLERFVDDVRAALH